MKNENDLSTTSALCDSLVVIAAQKHMKFVPARFCVLRVSHSPLYVINFLRTHLI
jgi:hypothetical protein